MSSYKEIVTKAVVSKGKKLFTTTKRVKVTNPSTVLGCWVINHEFEAQLNDKKVDLETVKKEADTNFYKI